MARQYCLYILLIISTLALTLSSCKRKPYPDYLIPEPSETLNFTLGYGGNGDEELFSVIATSDSGYMMIGTTTTLSSGDKDMYLAKTDLNGNLLWSKAIGGAAIDGGFDLIETADHNCIAVGFSRSYNFTNGHEIFVVKTDLSGNILWQKTFGDINNDCAKRIILSADGNGYILTGGTNGANIQLGNMIYVVKMSSDGDSVWTRTYDGNAIEIGASVCNDFNNHMMVLGSSDLSSTIDDLFLIYLDANGDSVWTKTIGGAMGERAGEIIPLPGNNFVAANTTKSFGDPNGDILLFKISDTGVLMWQKVIDSGNAETGTSILLTSDNHLMVAGSENNPSGTTQALLIQTDQDGNVLWKKTFGDSANFHTNKVIETNSAFLLTGTKQNLNGSTDGFLVKVKK